MIHKRKELRIELKENTIFETSQKKYRIVEPLGEGGNACVWRIKEETTNEFYVLKICFPTDNILRKDPKVFSRFNRERIVLSKIKHRNIIKIVENYGSLPFEWKQGDAIPILTEESKMRVWRSLDFSPYKKEKNETWYPYFILESCECNLESYIIDYKTEQCILNSEKLIFMIEMCKGLQALQSYTGGKVTETEEKNYHRDVKPANILIKEEDGKKTIKIGDFGIAHLSPQYFTDIASSYTSSGEHPHPARYASPEQLTKDGIIDYRTDIYSLGLVFYHLVAGELFVARYKDIQPKEINRIVLDMIEEKPEDRPKIEEIIETLEKIRGTYGISDYEKKNES